MNRPNSQSPKHASWAVGGLLVVLAVTGYFMGLQRSSSHISLSRIPESILPVTQSTSLTNPVGIPTIENYAALDRKKNGPNAHFPTHLSTITRSITTNTVQGEISETRRLEAIEQRGSRRAFDGAPPVVPHPIQQDSTASCLACHGLGLVVKDRIAPKISHPHFANCTQCHVPAKTGPRITDNSALMSAIAENSFSHATQSLKGRRAWPGAPPTIPHPTQMRTDCNSCHGPLGLPGLRTQHPERSQCTQCHVSDAVLDQRMPVGGLNY